MPPNSQERPAQSNPHQPFKIYCRLAATSPMARPFQPKPIRSVVTTGKTQQFGEVPGLERTELNPWLQNSEPSEQKSAGSRLPMPNEPQSNGPRLDVEDSIGIGIWARSTVGCRRDTASVCDILYVETEVVLIDLNPCT
jgi:hypothetical protein